MCEAILEDSKASILSEIYQHLSIERWREKILIVMEFRKRDIIFWFMPKLMRICRMTLNRKETSLVHMSDSSGPTKSSKSFCRSIRDFHGNCLIDRYEILHNNAFLERRFVKMRDGSCTKYQLICLCLVIEFTVVLERAVFISFPRLLIIVCKKSIVRRKIFFQLLFEEYLDDL